MHYNDKKVNSFVNYMHTIHKLRKKGTPVNSYVKIMLFSLCVYRHNTAIYYRGKKRIFGIPLVRFLWRWMPAWGGGRPWRGSHRTGRSTASWTPRSSTTAPTTLLRIELMNEWLHERLIKWMIDCIIECMNEWKIE